MNTSGYITYKSTPTLIQSRYHLCHEACGLFAGERGYEGEGELGAVGVVADPRGSGPGRGEDQDHLQLPHKLGRAQEVFGIRFFFNHSH